MSLEQGTDQSDLYRPCVGIALFNKTGKVFVGERIDSPGAWQMPQGGIDKGETIERAALRELGEEVGTQNVEILEISQKKIRYDLPDNLRQTLWNGKYKGQEQNWVAAQFLGEDTEINLQAHKPAEFSNWQWVDLKNISDLIVPFKKETYKQVIDLFQKHASQIENMLAKTTII